MSIEDNVRLFCDEMLARLGRWLRAAGYDTAIAANGMPDTALIASCLAEKRILLTRDRHLAAVAAGRVAVVRLAEAGLATQAQAFAPRSRSTGRTRRSPAVSSTTRRSRRRRPR